MRFMKLSIVALGLCLALPSVASVKGKKYRVHVFPSYSSTAFIDCFSFGENGVLNVDLLGELRYAYTRLNTQEYSWQSVPLPNAVRLYVAFHGHEIRGEFAGDGVSEQGDTFLISGFEDPDCAVGPGSAEASAYSRPNS